MKQLHTLLNESNDKYSVFDQFLENYDSSCKDFDKIKFYRTLKQVVEIKLHDAINEPFEELPENLTQIYMKSLSELINEENSTEQPQPERAIMEYLFRQFELLTPQMDYEQYLLSVKSCAEHLFVQETQD